MTVDVNYWAIIVCAILSIVLGSLWYGPIFGKPWMKMMGFNAPDKVTPEQKKQMMKSYAITTVGSLVMAFVLAHTLIFASTYLNSTGIWSGIGAGFWNWLGFVAPTTLGTVTWEGKPWKLWFINSGFYLVYLIIAGIILALWV